MLISEANVAYGPIRVWKSIPESPRWLLTQGQSHAAETLIVVRMMKLES